MSAQSYEYTLADLGWTDRKGRFVGATVSMAVCGLCRALILEQDRDDHRRWHLAMELATEPARLAGSA